MIWHTLCDSKHQNGPSGVQIAFFAISKMAVLSGQFWCRNICNRTLHSSYGNFTDNIITDQCKFDFEKKVLNFLESDQSVGVQAIQMSFFYENDIFKPNPSSKLECKSSSIENFKICEISKSTLAPYLEIV